jgi:ParB family transcriptional regulator, chromosome partitioning protein
MQIITISPADVDFGERLRGIDDDYAALIGAAIAQNGQRSPIEVRPRQPDGKWPLITGAHRVRGAILEGLTEIDAIVRDVTAQQAELMEIDENLTRHDLNELDRAIFLARRKELYEDLYPAAKAGGNRRKISNDKFVAKLVSFTEDTAEKLGCSRKSIERAVRRANDIPSDVLAQIKGTWIARKGIHLDALVRLTNEEQRLVVAQVLSRGATTLADAISSVRGQREARVDVPTADFEKLKRVYLAADVTAQARFRTWVAKHGRGQ